MSSLNVLDYTCGECRRGGITSRAAAARLAPRTIATLFMAKRRFNKYAHKQYMQSRLPKPKRSDEESLEMVVPEACDEEPESSEVSDPLDGTPVIEPMAVVDPAPLEAEGSVEDALPVPVEAETFSVKVEAVTEKAAPSTEAAVHGTEEAATGTAGAADAEDEAAAAVKALMDFGD